MVLLPRFAFQASQPPLTALTSVFWCPRPGFEPATYRLQGDCSTTELQGQNFCGSLYVETLLTPQGDQVGKLQLPLLTPDNQILYRRGSQHILSATVKQT
jgi:hypothetical protein